ncbi:hypothetical protein BDW66DRAFT_153828 [Aspergillus desertorum]
MAVNILVTKSGSLIRKMKVEYDLVLGLSQDPESSSASEHKHTTTEQQPEQQPPSDPAADLEQQSIAEPKATASWWWRCPPIEDWLAAIATFMSLFLGVFVVTSIVLAAFSIVTASWSYGIEKVLRWFPGPFVVE